LESHPKLILKTEKRIGKRVETFDTDYLPNRMGLFLQKINIIKDAMGDLKAGRVFWPEVSAII
jgi:phytoene/squalene synthetase